MKVVIQRVKNAAVTVDGKTISSIGSGLLIFAGFTHDDEEAAIRWSAHKVAGLRIFEDEDGRMNRSIIEARGEALVVSQFTLYADVRKGRRPAFVDAADAAFAEPMFDRFCELLESEGLVVKRGRFAARMEVSLVNDGPVTIVFERSADGEWESEEVGKWESVKVGK